MSAPDATFPRGGRAWWPAALFALAALFAFWPALRGQWLWDDAPEITRNPEVTGDGMLAKIWSAPSQMDYFPLKTTVEWAAWRIWGDHVAGYHLLSLALHVLSACLVWRLLTRLRIAPAWLGGALFAIHPLTVESVAWIAELKNTLALPPLLLAMSAYVDFDGRGGRGRYAASLAWFVVSLLCKTSGVMLPVVLLLYHGWNSGRVTLRHLRLVAPFFVAAFALGLVTLHFQHARAIGGLAIPLGGFASRLAVAGVAALFYLGKYLLPVPLVPIYRQWSMNPPAALDFLPWLVFAGVGFAAWRARARWGAAVWFALGAYLALIAPVLGFVAMSYMHYSWVADHFVYLPLVPLVGLTVAAVGAGANRLPPGVRRVAAGGGGLALAALLFLARRHAETFRDEFAYWSYTARHNPASATAHTNLGRVLTARGDLTAARAEIEAALALDPRSALAHHHLGSVFLQLGRFADGEKEYRTALEIDPTLVAAHLNLGNSLMQQGRLDDAAAEFRRTAALAPNLVEAYNNLAAVLCLGGHNDEAITVYRRALEIDPKFAPAYDNVGRIYVATGRTAEAIAAYEKAVQLAPANADYHADLGYAYIVAGRRPDAVRSLETALRLRPDHAAAQLNLGGLLFQQGDLEGARQHFEAALRADPKSDEARRNLELTNERLQARRRAN